MIYQEKIYFSRRFSAYLFKQYKPKTLWPVIAIEREYIRTNLDIYRLYNKKSKWLGE